MEVREFRKPACAPEDFRLCEPSPSMRITQTERFFERLRGFGCPTTLPKALINTSPSIPKDLGGAGSIEDIEISLPQPF